MAYGIHSDVAQDRFKDKVSPCPITGCWFWVGSLMNNGYGEAWDGERRVTAHRLAYRLFVGDLSGDEMIDHKCQCKRCVNPDHLRKCNKSENGINRGKNKNNTSGFKGVSLDKRRNLWRSCITIMGKQMFLGYFKTPELASISYNNACVDVFGVFANSGVI